LAFWRKCTPLIDQKCTYEKVKKFGQGPSSPSFGQNPKEQVIFFVKPSLIDQFIFIGPLNQFWVIATWWCDETGRGTQKMNTHGNSFLLLTRRS
jgi:hypothetical protein